MLNALARLCCFLAALAAIEGPLLLSQSIAWLTMVQDRAPVMGFSNSVADTFSGRSPCEICQAVREERERRQEEIPAREADPLGKLVLVPTQTTRVVVTPPGDTVDHLSRPRVLNTLWHPDRPNPPPWAA